MPELPEVASAARRLARVARGKSIARVQVLHPALERLVPARALRAMRGVSISRVERRGKHQLLRFDDGAALHVHFRMSGTWGVARAGEPLPRHARLVIELKDGTRVALVDSRALGTARYYAAGVEPALPTLGPEADGPGFTAASLGRALARRTGAVKPALLDQRVVAGLGNIYAVEALWHARISPLRPTRKLGVAELRRLIGGVRSALHRGRRSTRARAREGRAGRLEVYDREGESCRRCGETIERVVQAGRSTYFCPACQR